LTTIQARPLASTETSGTLTSASANKTIQLTGDITINNSVFSRWRHHRHLCRGLCPHHYRRHHHDNAPRRHGDNRKPHTGS
jgi:hypothetical protein